MQLYELDVYDIYDGEISEVMREILDYSNNIKNLMLIEGKKINDVNKITLLIGKQSKTIAYRTSNYKISFHKDFVVISCDMNSLNHDGKDMLNQFILENENAYIKGSTSQAFKFKNENIEKIIELINIIENIT